jgi:hypothetical protein
VRWIADVVESEQGAEEKAKRGAVLVHCQAGMSEFLMPFQWSVVAQRETAFHRQIRDHRCGVPDEDIEHIA